MNTAILIIASGAVCYLFTLLALMDIYHREFGSLGKKALWVLIAAVPFLGFVLYFLFGRCRGERISP